MVQIPETEMIKFTRMIWIRVAYLFDGNVVIRNKCTPFNSNTLGIQMLWELLHTFQKIQLFYAKNLKYYWHKYAHKNYIQINYIWKFVCVDFNCFFTVSFRRMILFEFLPFFRSLRLPKTFWIKKYFQKLNLTMHYTN